MVGVERRLKEEGGEEHSLRISKIVRADKTAATSVILILVPLLLLLETTSVVALQQVDSCCSC